MKVFFLTAFAAVSPVLLWAQLSFSGSVTDKETGKALSGATVMLNKMRRAVTNTSGHFEISVKPGTYSLTISYLGYKKFEESYAVAAPLNVNIALAPAAFISDEVIVSATRANPGSAATYRNLSKEELDKNNLGQDLPFLLNQTPSVVVSSDAGAGVGYTGIRIRGSDPTRINVTINGIPYNDSESQGSFFVDIPDFASSVDNIQVQRGVGTSTNGAGAFGGSLNIQTNILRDSAYAELNNTYGSYKTIKNTLNIGSGLLGNRFTFDGRLSNLRSDGYIDNAFSKLKSYFLSGAWHGANNLLQANVFGGTERTYQAWNGVPEPMLETNRRYNVFNYADQTDNYTQHHYQLLYSHRFSTSLSFNSALHYTGGKGYYEEFKNDQAFADYGIQPFTAGVVTYDSGNLIRRRWLDNHFYGATGSLEYTGTRNLLLMLGGAWNRYRGKHYGEVVWNQYSFDNNDYLQPYYEGYGVKSDANVYSRAEIRVSKLTLSADLQFRHIGYDLSGLDDNRNRLNQDDYLNFFNPKFGATLQLGNVSDVYASFAVANKEPNRDDYIHSTLATRPKPEALNDIEAGYRYTGERMKIGLNAFGMFYRNQLILTGKINDVGEYIRQNVAKSYRIGLELDGSVRLNSRLNWSANASLSRNTVKDYVAYDDDYDNGGQIVSVFANSRLAFSPSFVGSSELSWSPVEKAEIALLSKYVSRQFLDNTANSARQLDAFFVNDLRFRLNFPGKSLKNISVSLLVNNVFSELYESNGYTFSYLYGGEYSIENYYFPQAERNFMLGLNMKF